MDAGRYDKESHADQTFTGLFGRGNVPGGSVWGQRQGNSRWIQDHAGNERYSDLRNIKGQWRSGNDRVQRCHYHATGKIWLLWDGRKWRDLVRGCVCWSQLLCLGFKAGQCSIWQREWSQTYRYSEKRRCLPNEYLLQSRDEKSGSLWGKWRKGGKEYPDLFGNELHCQIHLLCKTETGRKHHPFLQSKRQ